MAKDKDWEAKLAKKASSDRAREKTKGGGLGNQISTAKKRFSFGGEVVGDNKGRTLRGVIVDFAYLRTYYGKKFVEGEGGIPKCFALSEDGEDMEPHDNSPKKQAKACEGCPRAEWGSGSGRAQACSDRRRLAFLHEDDIGDAESVAEANWGQLTLAPTSLKNWSKFLKECEEKLSRPTYAIITEMTFDEDQNYPVLVFEASEKIKDKEVVEAIEARREELRELLMQPFEGSSDDDDEDDEDDDRKKSKKGSKKARPKKDDEDDEDDEDDDEDDEDEDDKPSKKSKAKKRKPKDEDEDDDDEEDDEDDDDDDDEDDDEDDEDDAPKSKKKGGKKLGKGKRKSSDDDDDDDDDDDEDDADDRKSSGKGKGGKKGKAKDDEADEDSGKGAKKRKGSRFGK